MYVRRGALAALAGGAENARKTSAGRPEIIFF
jgi:hypothetical protein